MLDLYKNSSTNLKKQTIMKKLLIFLPIVLILTNVTGQESMGKYIFPMMPKDKEWKEYRYPERVKILQINEEKLNTFSNIELLGACYEYPFYINFYAFNTAEEGFRNLCSIFNGYPEIFKRKEKILDDLIAFYKAMDTNEFKEPFTRFNDYYSPTKMLLFEYILSSDDFLLNATLSQRANLYKECREKFFLKEDNIMKLKGNAFFSEIDLLSTATIISKLVLLNKKAVNPGFIFSINEFLEYRKYDSSYFKKLIEFMDLNN
jgi:hypothetical protein